MWHKLGRTWSSLSSQLRHAQQTQRVVPKRYKYNHVGVLAAPFNKGQRREGVQNGPETIKKTGILTQLQDFGINVVDYGTVEMDTSEESSKLSLGPDGERNHTSVLTYSHRLADAVSSVIQKGGLCLTLGGDHSISIGTINGHAQANTDHQVAVLWIDAHADINTGPSSETGNMHGMPVSHHLKELSNTVNRLANGWPQPCMSSRDIVYVGLRDVDHAERKFLDDLSILYYDMKDVDQLGIMEIIDKCIEALKPSADRPLHVSFDIDALDPTEAPSTGTPVRAGLTLREGLKIVEVVRDTGFMKAFDIVEVNPALGSKNDVSLTADSARLILLGALAGHGRM